MLSGGGYDDLSTTSLRAGATLPPVAFMQPRRLEPLDQLDPEETPLVGFASLMSASGSIIVRLDQSGRLFTQEAAWKRPQEFPSRETFVSEESTLPRAMSEETREPVKAFHSLNFVPVFQRIAENFLDLAEKEIDSTLNSLVLALDTSNASSCPSCFNRCHLCLLFLLYCRKSDHTARILDIGIKEIFAKSPRTRGCLHSVSFSSFFPLSQ